MEFSIIWPLLRIAADIGRIPFLRFNLPAPDLQEALRKMAVLIFYQRVFAG